MAHVDQYWESDGGDFTLHQGSCLDAVSKLEEGSFDTVFADPPYFLSNGGTTCKGGKRVSVGKGDWDVSAGICEDHKFHTEWLEACRRVLKKDGTLWVSGTSHNIYSVGFSLQKIGYKILNQVTWEKPNPPPNLSCRYLTHSTETLIWAAKSHKSKHFFNYKALKEQNNNKQMKDVWKFCPPRKHEKSHGRHPTQKPVSLLDRVLLASCPPGGKVLDPFNGSGTTGVSCARLGLSYHGVDLDAHYLEISRSRIIEAASLRSQVSSD